MYVPSLETLLYNLDAANSHPNYALDHLRDLASDVDRLTDKLDYIEGHFCKGKDDREIVRNYMINAIREI